MRNWQFEIPPPIVKNLDYRSGNAHSETMFGEWILFFTAWLPLVLGSLLWAGGLNHLSSGERAQIFVLFVLAQPMLLGQYLGYLGLLTPVALISAQWALFLISAGIGHYRGWLAESWVYWRRQPAYLASILTSDRWLLTGCLLVVPTLLILLVSGILAVPLDFDSHGYRLSRIGLWLQEGWIGHSITDDPRMNYSAILGDLWMAWLVMPFREGYPLVCAAQFPGLLLGMLTLWNIARTTGGNRLTALAAACLPFSIPLFVAQTTTSQVDLLTAGATISAYYFLTQSLHILADKGKLETKGWIGIGALGLALGIKGSLFYILPFLLIL